MTKELLQQCLDALIESRGDVDLCYAGVKAARLSFRQERQLGFYEEQLVKHDAAIEGLKQALAQQEQCGCREGECETKKDKTCRMTIEIAERDGIPEWTPAIGIECAISNLRDDAARLRDGSYTPLQIADDLDVIANDLGKCKSLTQQEQPNPWKDAVIEQLVVHHAIQPEHNSDPVKAVHDLLCISNDMALDPLVSSAAQALIDRGRKEAQQEQEPAQEQYPLPDSLYPGSKDWQAGSYKERVEWLHLMYESERLESIRLENVLASIKDEPTQPALSEARWNYINSRAVDMSAAKYEALCSLLHAEVDSTYELGEAVDKAIEAHCRGGANK